MPDLIAAPRTIPYADLAGSLGVRSGPTPWSMVTQPQVEGFADLTHDHQWIHVDEERAKDGPFGTTIAHGYLPRCGWARACWRRPRSSGSKRATGPSC